jgi:hypothetical protein
MVEEINLSNLRLDQILKSKTEIPFSLKDFRLFLSKNENSTGLRYLKFYEWTRWYRVFYYSNIEAYNKGIFRMSEKMDRLTYEFPELYDFGYSSFMSSRNSEDYEPASILEDYAEDLDNSDSYDVNNETFVSDSTGSRAIAISHLPFSDIILDALHAFFNPQSQLYFPIPTNIFVKFESKLKRSTEPRIFQPIAEYVYYKLEKEFYPSFAKSVVKESKLRDRVIWLLLSILFLFVLGIVYWRLAVTKLDLPVYIACLPLWFMFWFCLLNTIFGIPPLNYYSYFKRKNLSIKDLSAAGNSSSSLEAPDISKTSQISTHPMKIVKYKTKHKIWLFIVINTVLAICFTSIGLLIPLKLYAYFN